MQIGFYLICFFMPSYKTMSWTTYKHNLWENKYNIVF